MTVLVSREAPDFTAPAVMPDNTINSSFRLSDYKGKPIVLFFWPLDFSFVCPTEIIAHDRRLDAFNKRGIQVIGVSVDSQYTHLAWKKTPRTKGGIGSVRFPLVADVNHEITQKYGIEHPDGVALRATFLIDPDGIVQSQIINNLNLGRNVDEILRMADAQAYSRETGKMCPAGWESGKSALEASAEGLESYLSEFSEDL
jgi:peroxiredoxin (alkyl hydroperoxide reductase subunit C)